MNATQKAIVLAVVRHKSAGLSSIKHHISLLQNAAKLFPSFESFRELCKDHLRESWGSDQVSKQRTTQIVRRSWTRLFRYVATHLCIDKDLKIHALDRHGNYECVLIQRIDRGDDWRQFVRLGRLFDIRERELRHLARRVRAHPSLQALLV